MNPLPPNTDELVSAYLDGQAAPDEIAIVESSPELMERVQSLRSIADLVGQPAAPPPAAQKEAHLSAALDAFDALFAAESAETTPLVAAAPHTTVTTSPEPSIVEAAPSASTPPEGVTSLAAARERRRPRRFNPGVIAAAAVVLLFVALAAFGLGGGGDSLDVASSEAAGDASSDTTSVETSSDAMSDDEEAMNDEASRSALSDVSPSPTAGAVAAAPQAAPADSVEDAMEAEEEAMDDEEAMSDAAAEEPEADFDDEGSNQAGAAAESLNREPFRLFAGEFDDQDDLLLELKQLPVDEFAALVEPLEPGLFDSCQADVSILSAIATPTIIGEAIVAGDLVEVHRIGNADDLMIVLVDPSDCSILDQAP